MQKRAGGTKRERMRKRLRATGEPCAICGKPIDYDLEWWIDPQDGKRKKHPYSFEWDHIEPFANGGDDSWENAQVVHRICNQRKGNGRQRRQMKAKNDASAFATSQAY